MPLDRLMGPIWVFGIALLFYLYYRLEQKERMQIYELIHKERMQAIDKGLPYPELPPYLIEKEDKEETAVRKPFSPRMLVGIAAILILGGGATMWALRFSGEEYHQKVWTFGAIPVFLGFGLLLYALLNRKAGDE